MVFVKPRVYYSCSIFWYMTTSSCFEFSFSFSSDRATMYNTGSFKLAIVKIWVLVPRRYIVAYDFHIFADNCVTFCELPLWEICILRIVQAEEILIDCFVECHSIKKVVGRRSVEELYQALFFVSPVPPECFTEPKAGKEYLSKIVMWEEKGEFVYRRMSTSCSTGPNVKSCD